MALFLHYVIINIYVKVNKVRLCEELAILSLNYPMYIKTTIKKEQLSFCDVPLHISGIQG